MKKGLLFLIVFVLSLVSAGAAWSDDHGDSCDTATPISFDSSGKATVNIVQDTIDDVDYLKIVITVRGALNIIDSFSDAPYYSIAGELKNSSCTTIAQGDNDPYGTIISVQIDPGTYYIAIQCEDQFTLQVSYAKDDHGDSFNSATSVSIGTSGTASIQGATQSYDDWDYFRIELPDIGSFTTSVSYPNQGNADPPLIKLFDSNYSLISESMVTLSEQIIAGTYFSAIYVDPIWQYNYTVDFEFEAQTGALTVTIAPPEATEAGAQWRIGTGDWQDSTATISGLAPGDYIVSFRDFNKTVWTKPANQKVSITAGQTTTTTGTYIQLTGSIKVTIDPPDAAAAGAQWQVDGGAWQNSGVTQSGLPVGNHTVQFKAIPGWTTPANQTVAVTNGATTSRTGTYVRQLGSLTVTLSPAEALAAGAQWRVDGGGWLDGGSTQNGLFVGSHTIEFKPISGWATPGNQSVSIASGLTTTASATYSQQTGSLTVTIGPSEAVSAGARWKVDGGDWQASGETVVDLSVGSHLVEFEVVADWIEPSPETVTVAEDQTTSLTADYTAEESTPPQVREVLPLDGAGIDTDTRVPRNVSFAVRLADESGIDITQAESVVFDVSYYDEVNSKNHAYTRDIGNKEMRVVKLFDADSNDAVTELWAVYDKAREIAVDGGNSYPFDTEISVTVTAADVFGNTLVSGELKFKTETEDQHDQALDPANLPVTTTTAGSNQTTIEVQSGNLEGVQLIYANNEPIKPRFGPELDEIPELDVAQGVGWPLNLQPSTVFNRPVTIRIPFPDHSDVSELSIYYYDGAQWKLACDGSGQVQAGGEGWIVPGSRKNFNYYEDPVNNDPSVIEIQVYHFSGLQAGANTPQTGSLTVTITPQDAVDDGARWRFNGGDWQNSGYTESNLSLGSHNVEFKSVSGWITPKAQTVTIEDGQTATATGAYTEDSGQGPEGGASGSGGGGGGGCFIGSMMTVF